MSPDLAEIYTIIFTTYIFTTIVGKCVVSTNMQPMLTGEKVLTTWKCHKQTP